MVNNFIHSRLVLVQLSLNVRLVPTVSTHRSSCPNSRRIKDQITFKKLHASPGIYNEINVHLSRWKNELGTSRTFQLLQTSLVYLLSYCISILQTPFFAITLSYSFIYPLLYLSYLFPTKLYQYLYEYFVEDHSNEQQHGNVN